MLNKIFKMGVLVMKRLKTGILFNIISLTLCLSAIVINVYSATVSQVNISGSLGYVKHESSFTVSFVKGTPSDFPSASGRFDFATAGYGTIKYQIDGNGTWVNLIQNDDLVSSISGVESSIQFRLTGKRITRFVIGHYAILNNNKEVFITGWPFNDGYEADAVVTTDLISVSSSTTFIIGCVTES